MRASGDHVVDPGLADKARQRTALAAKAPLRAAAEQDGTIGLGLFDAADQPAFRLEGEADRSLGDILDEIDGDAAAIDAARKCL